MISITGRIPRSLGERLKATSNFVIVTRVGVAEVHYAQWLKTGG